MPENILLSLINLVKKQNLTLLLLLLRGLNIFLLGRPALSLTNCCKSFCEEFLRVSLAEFQCPIFCAVELFENMSFTSFRLAYLNSFSFITNESVKLKLPNPPSRQSVETQDVFKYSFGQSPVKI